MSDEGWVIGQSGKGTIGACFLTATKAKVLQSETLSAYCQGTHGLLSFAPPIVTLVTLQLTTAGTKVLSVVGTPYPAMEVWEYGAGAPQLVYYYDPGFYGTNPAFLFAPMPLPNPAKL